MNRSKKILQFIDHGIFHGYTLFIYGMTYEEVVGKLKKIKKSSEWLKCLETSKEHFEKVYNWGSCFQRTISVTRGGKVTRETRYSFIYVKSFDFSDDDMCALAHEVVHLCQFVLPDFLDRNKEIEAEAYFHTHIMDQCLKALRK